MSGMMLGDFRVIGITEKEIGEAFVAQSEEVMPLGVVQRAFTADLMRLGPSLGVDDRYLAAQRVMMVDPAQRDLDCFGQARGLVIQPECRRQSSVDIQTRHLGNLDGRPVIRDCEAFSKGQGRMRAEQPGEQEDDLSHGCSIGRFRRNR